MPQLDKVTLFSQVFWLLFLYFFFFLVFLKHYLPSFGKLFKFRYYYLAQKGDSLLSSSRLVDLSKFLSSFKDSWILVNQTLISYYEKCITDYNVKLLNLANSTFIKAYNYNCLKFKLYRKIYL